MKQPKIIACVGTKGGVGKSTTTYNLSLLALSRGYNVAVVDCDEQKTIIKALARRKKLNEGKSLPKIYSTHTPDEATVKGIIRTVQSEHSDTDLIFMDMGGYISKPMVDALIVADFVLLVTQPATFDFMGFQDTFRVVKDAKDRMNHWAVFLNRIDKGETESLEGEIYEALKSLPQMKTKVHDHRRIRTAQKKGVGATEYYSGQAHSTEYHSLLDEIMEVLKND